jgi:hypothetical protein
MYSSTFRNSSKRSLLWILPAALVGLLAMTAVPQQAAAAKGCGTVMFTTGKHRVIVTKGQVGCKTARKLIWRSAKRSGSTCGTAMRRSCPLGGCWLGRIAYPGETPISVFAYVPKAGTPPIPFYRAGQFRAAVIARKT